MDSELAKPTLETLFYRLAVVNAQLHELHHDEVELLQERRGIMEMITRERLGLAPKRVVWTPETAYMA